MEVDFQGAEIETPLGSLTVGLGYSRRSGSDYFRGLIVDLPIGKFRLGWRTWSSEFPDTEKEREQEEKRRVNAQQREKESLIQHLLTFGIVMAIISAFDFVLGGASPTLWVLSIWGAVLSMHAFRVCSPPLVNWLVKQLPFP